MELKYPNLRLELIQNLESLCHIHKYVDDLIKNELDMDYFSMGDLLNFLFDDLELRSPENELIGEFLFNSHEYNSLQKLLDALERAIPNDKTSLDRDIKYLLKNNELDDVINRACAIQKELKEWKLGNNE